MGSRRRFSIDGYDACHGMLEAGINMTRFFGVDDDYFRWRVVAFRRLVDVSHVF